MKSSSRLTAGYAVGVGLALLAGMTGIADTASARCLASNQWAYGNCGGGGYSGGGGGTDYSGAIGAGIGLGILAIEVLPGVIGTVGDIAGGAAEIGSGVIGGAGDVAGGVVNAGVGAASSVGEAGTSGLEAPGLFKLFTPQPAVADTGADKKGNTPPNCSAHWSMSFQEQGEQQYKTALSVGNNSAEAGDAGGYANAAEMAREAAEHFRCARNAKGRAAALKLAKDLDARASKRASLNDKKAKKQQVEENNWRWKNFLNRPQIDQIKQEVRTMREQGKSSKQIMKALKQKGYTNEDISSAIGELKETG